MCKNAKTKTKNILSHVTCGCQFPPLFFEPFPDVTFNVQNLYSVRELSIKLLLGEKRRKKTNISPFPSTRTYIKLTLVSFVFLFFLHLSLNGNMTSMHLINVYKMGSYGNCSQKPTPPPHCKNFGLILPGFFAHFNWAAQLK